MNVEIVRGSRTGRPIMALLDLLGRRWTLRIIWELHLASPCPLTFRALQERCEDMSSSVLNQRLAELRDAQLMASVTGGYSLTADGAGLVALLLPLDAWANNRSCPAVRI
jgi:DNA-binding HxlR family transcriptional regulator